MLVCFLICCHWVSLFSVHKHWTFHSPANEAESENELDVEQQLLLLLSFVASATCLISVRRAVFVLTALFWRRSLEGGTYLCWRGTGTWLGVGHVTFDRRTDLKDGQWGRSGFGSAGEFFHVLPASAPNKKCSARSLSTPSASAGHCQTRICYAPPAVHPTCAPSGTLQEG